MAGSTMTSASLYTITTLNNKSIFIADTTTRRVGVNTLAPSSALHVNGNTLLNGSVDIIGYTGNIASITNGVTNAILSEINNKETTPYQTENMCCKVLSVDKDNRIVLVKLPPSMCTLSVACGGTPTPTPVDGVCGSANNQTVSTAPTTNLCSVGSASRVS